MTANQTAMKKDWTLFDKVYMVLVALALVYYSSQFGGYAELIQLIAD